METSFGEAPLPGREGDAELLGFEDVGPGRVRFTLTRALSRHDGKLYGGTGVAAAVALAERITGRPALWATVQFVSGESVVGDRIDCEVEVLASGRRTAQVRVRGAKGGQVLFEALAATGLRKEQGLEGTFATMPVVPPPDDCPAFRFPIPEDHQGRVSEGHLGLEMRVAERVAVPPAPGQLRFWARVRDLPATPAVIGYLADMVPMSVVHAFGRFGGGTSLDNTIRIGHPSDTEWVLIDLHPHLAVGGYGHGEALAWSPDGVLLAVASQTASLISFG